MRDPNPNSSASLTATPSQSTASKIPESPTNSVITPPIQPPPAPPPQPPPPPTQTYRTLAPLDHLNPLQQSADYYNYLQSIQNQSAVLHPFSSPGRGFLVRPVRGFVADPSLMARNQNGYSPFPGLAFNHRQVAPNQMDHMAQFLRHRMQQLAPPGSGYPVGSGPIRGRPQVWQPRVGRPRTALLDAYKNKRARSKDEDLVLVRGRKVRLTEGPSLYPLCRSWLKNGDHVGIQLQRTGTMNTLPKPLPVVKTDTSVTDLNESPDEDKEDEDAVKDLSEKDLLKRHIKRAKKVRERFKEERWKKIKRFTERLALLLPSTEGELYTPEEDIL